jgi:hypothetical protein
MKQATKVTGLLLVLSLLCISNTSGQQAEEIFKFIRTVEVTPDATFLTGSFARIN